MSGSGVNARRAYDNAGRAEQAAANRRRIVAAARRMLVEHGYAAMTMAMVAKEAGVAVDTVYKGFKSKRELIKQVLAVAVVGDDQPIALADRPQMQAARAEPTGAGMLTRYAAAVREVYARLGSLPTMLMSGARAGEQDLREFADTASANRLIDATGTIEQLAATGDMQPLSHDDARDILWTLNSPEVHHLLTVDRGWSDTKYERWLTNALIDGLLRRATADSAEQTPPRHDTR